jgi:hypothetical protein
MSVKERAGRADCSGVWRRSKGGQGGTAAVAEAPRLPLLSIAAESQVWHRSVASTGGTRSPSGRIHAVFGKNDHTLCGLASSELAVFPSRDFTEGSLRRCEICRARGAQLLH